MNGDAAKQTAESLPTESLAIAADVSKEADVERYAEQALDRFGRIDLYHLNAGILGTLDRLTDLTVDDFDRVTSVNLRGPFLGLRTAFRCYESQGNGGAIVLTSSIGGLRGSADLLPYQASKHGVIGLTYGAAMFGGRGGCASTPSRPASSRPGCSPGWRRREEPGAAGDDHAPAAGRHPRGDRRGGGVPARGRRGVHHRRGGVGRRRCRDGQHRPSVRWRGGLASRGDGVTEERPVGFVGLGNMGGRIARRVIEGGHRVLGHDSDPGKVAAAGADPAGSAAGVAEGSDTILLSLPDSTAVEAVVTGAGGLLGACRPGQVVVDLSTAAPDSTVWLHAALRERGVTFLDAGVTGGAAAAERGALTLMVGGSADAVGALYWLFDLFAAKVFVMGDSGAGHTAKLLNNFLNAVSLAATAEVMVAGRAAAWTRGGCSRSSTRGAGRTSRPASGSRTSSGATTWRAASPAR
ncbi:NAD(P)-dependent oxidoreductase [Actinomadura madurae]|uniref:NAD(P)-dependent oxidoreductase n=1 Tax=Actinomadura madurae TaxID=1993 RepID=UPI003FD7FC9A